MREELFEDEFKALGTQIHIWVSFEIGEEKKIRKDIEELQKQYYEKEKKLSRFNPESELCFLNHNLGKFNKASEDIIHLAKKSLGYFDLSEGFFDPRIIEILENVGYDRDFKAIKSKMSSNEANFKRNNSFLGDNLKIRDNEVMFNKRMDFSGIAKGYITDEGAKFLKNRGWKNFILDSGGDMFVSGTNNNEKWEIELDGFSAEKLKLQIQDEAVATSGITRRKWETGGKKFHHLINPKNPNNFSFDLKSVSVISDTTENADVFAKTLFLIGKNEGLQFANQKNIPAIYLDYRGDIFISNIAKEYITSN